MDKSPKSEGEALRDWDMGREARWVGIVSFCA